MPRSRKRDGASKLLEEVLYLWRRERTEIEQPSLGRRAAGQRVYCNVAPVECHKRDQGLDLLGSWRSFLVYPRGSDALLELRIATERRQVGIFKHPLRVGIPVFDGFAKIAERLRPITLKCRCARQVVHRGECVPVLSAEHALADVERLAVERLGFLGAALGGMQIGDARVDAIPRALA